jgi:hypothetical protein
MTAAELRLSERAQRANGLESMIRTALVVWRLPHRPVAGDG